MNAGIVLAAGGDSGREPWQLRDWRGRPALQWAIDRATAADLEAVEVVLGAAADEIIESLELHETTVVVDLQWQQGPASWLRVGLDALMDEPALEWAVFIPGDMPDIPAELLNRLLEATSRGKPVVVPRYRYTVGYPVAVARSLWERIIGTGAGDLLSLLAAHPDWVEEVWVETRVPARVSGDQEPARRKSG